MPQSTCESQEKSEVVSLSTSTSVLGIKLLLTQSQLSSPPIVLFLKLHHMTTAQSSCFCFSVTSKEQLFNQISMQLRGICVLERPW